MQEKQSGSRRRDAYYGILLLGIVSLMGDIVYEGSRGLVPSYLEFLGATAVVVGLVGGLGDFLGYSVRLVTGFLSDSTRAYWFFIFLGYGLVGAIPLLGVPLGIEIAIVLVLLERFGKAIRSPSRDTVLSVISKDVGAGKAFGIHEFLDQMGAISGPLIVAFLMLVTANYNTTFILLLIPFFGLMIALAITYRKTRAKTVPAEARRIGGKREKLTRPFYIYSLAVLLNTVGLVPASLILFKVSGILPGAEQWLVPLVYFVIQAVDAPVALIAGYTYDRIGIIILVLPFTLSVFPPLLTMFGTGLTVLMLAAAFYGLVLGMQESIYRAAVSGLTDVSSRGTAYGVFNTAYGFGYLLSGAVYGLLIDFKVPFAGVIPYVLATQIVAIALLLRIRPRLREQRQALNARSKPQ